MAASSNNGNGHKKPDGRVNNKGTSKPRPRTSHIQRLEVGEQILALFMHEGKNAREISEITGIPVSTVNYQINRVRAVIIKEKEDYFLERLELLLDDLFNQAQEQGRYLGDRERLAKDDPDRIDAVCRAFEATTSRLLLFAAGYPGRRREPAGLPPAESPEGAGEAGSADGKGERAA